MHGRVLLNLALLLTGLASAGSGLTMQVKYHIGHHGYVDATNGGYAMWSQFHKLASMTLLALVAWHLIVNWKWLHVTWNKGLFHKHRQLVAMSLIFVAAVITGLGAWAIGWSGLGFWREKIVVEIHDKLTIFLTGFLFLHVWSRRRRLAN
ncbi:MAG TPA: DUF4405 domain-containing protein [Polyangiaceae bacterium]